MMNLLRLSRMTGQTDLEKKASQLSEFFSGYVNSHPSAFTQMLCAIDFALGPSFEIVIAGEAEDKKTGTIVRTIQEEFIPNAVVLFVPADLANPTIFKLAPFTQQHGTLEGRATAYVCSNFSCKQPTSDPEQLLLSLGVKKTAPNS